MLNSAIRTMAVATGLAVMSGLFGASIASAATLTNRDNMAHKVIIVTDGTRREITLAASQRVADLCKKACELYLDDDPDPYELASADRLEIEEGELFYEEKTH